MPFVFLSSANVDTFGDKRSDVFVGSSFISYQNVDLLCGPDQGRADFSDLAMVGYDDSLARLAHHRAVYRCLVRVVCGETSLDMYPIDADKNFVHEHLTGTLNSRIANQCEPVAAEKPSGYKNFQIVALAQFHRDIHGVG